MQPSTCTIPDAKRRVAAEDVNGKGVHKKTRKKWDEVDAMRLGA